MVHILAVGSFTRLQLARLRLVSRAFRDAASYPAFYSNRNVGNASELDIIPSFVADGIRPLQVLSSRHTVDLADLATLLPNLTYLYVPKATNADRLPVSLSTLNLVAGKDHGADTLSRLTNLECLELHQLSTVPRFEFHPQLRRLPVRRVNADPLDLVSALAASDAAVAGTLEALFVQWPVSGGWWEPLADLANLREFGLSDFKTDPAAADDARALAAVLAAHPSLAVLHLAVAPVVATEVVRRGLPSTLRVFHLNTRLVAFETLVPVLPPDLTALSFDNGASRVADEVRALLARCAHLRALNCACRSDAAEVLSRVANRPMLLPVGPGIDASLWGALENAGHSFGVLDIEVHWCIAGGVMLNGKAVEWS